LLARGVLGELGSCTCSIPKSGAWCRGPRRHPTLRVQAARCVHGRWRHQLEPGGDDLPRHGRSPPLPPRQLVRWGSALAWRAAWAKS